MIGEHEAMHETVCIETAVPDGFLFRTKTHRIQCWLMIQYHPVILTRAKWLYLTLPARHASIPVHYQKSLPTGVECQPTASRKMFHFANGSASDSKLVVWKIPIYLKGFYGEV